jgi:sorbitol-specific phosphotransferase system component IIC
MVTVVISLSTYNYNLYAKAVPTLFYFYTDIISGCSAFYMTANPMFLVYFLIALFLSPLEGLLSLLASVKLQYKGRVHLCISFEDNGSA